jgi:cell division FtsZ-interacting protein ZapD
MIQYNNKGKTNYTIHFFKNVFDVVMLFNRGKVNTEYLINKNAEFRAEFGNAKIADLLRKKEVLLSFVLCN